MDEIVNLIFDLKFTENEASSEATHIELRLTKNKSAVLQESRRHGKVGCPTKPAFETTAMLQASLVEK